MKILSCAEFVYCSARTFLQVRNTVSYQSQIQDHYFKLRDSVLLLALMMCFPVFAIPQSDIVRFANLSQDLVFKRLDKELFQLQSSALQVQLAPRLIVKVSRATAASQLKQRIAAEVQVSELFLMQQEQYLLLSFADMEQALAALPQLQQDPLVLLVQPDLQQKRVQAQLKSAAQSDLSEAPLPAYVQWAKAHLNWNAGAGKGVTVAVIDDGFDLSHPEFGQSDIALHYDFNQKKMLGSQTEQSQGQHGTKVAGVLFGAQNGIAPEGLVPAATLVAIAQPDTWTSHTLQSFYIAYLAGADVINCSWHSRWLLQPVVDVVNELSVAGRRGKGTAVVFAAGNEGKQLTAQMHEASIASAITVAAYDRYDQPLPKSNFGAMVDLWVFGGHAVSTATSGQYGSFAGTSLSAAIVSGYMALLFSRCPELQLKQAQQQLADLMER